MKLTWTDCVALGMLAAGIFGYSIITAVYDHFSRVSDFKDRGILVVAQATSGQTHITKSRKGRETGSSSSLSIAFKTEEGKPVYTRVGVPYIHYGTTYPFDIQVYYLPERPESVATAPIETPILNESRLRTGWMLIAVGGLGLLYGGPRLYFLHREQKRALKSPPPQPSIWYVSINAETYGPYSWDQIAQMSPQVPSDALVWKDGLGNWMPLRQLLHG